MEFGGEDLLDFLGGRTVEGVRLADRKTAERLNEEERGLWGKIAGEG